MASLLSYVSDYFTVHAESTVTIPSTPGNTESVSSKSDDRTSQVAQQQDEDNAAAEAEDDNDAGEDAEEEEEEEEEEEAEDQKPAIVAECEQTKACAPYKHHFDECQERVMSKSDDDSHHEDCVEEMFHLMHCVDACMAPKLFAQLK